MNNEHKFENVNEIASSVLKNALFATRQNTFAVAGTLIENKTKRVIHSVHNNVIKLLSSSKPFTHDPTAHGERQIVSWYYENKDRLHLPAPEDLTIVTSLDPCMMCAGAILATGFNVGIIASDTFAGINHDSSFTFNTLPAQLREKAKNLFGYYASKDGPKEYVRDYCGGDRVAFKDTALDACNLASCEAIFGQSVENIRNLCSNSGIQIDQMQDPFLLPEDSPIKVAYRKRYPEAFKIKTKDSRLPCKKILDELERVLAKAQDADNAVAYIDPFGNLVLCMADSFDVSPVQTAFMNVTQNYARVRWNLIDTFKNDGANPYTYLSHPKDGTFVFLFAPNPADAITVMSLGAYGSTIEGPLPIAYPPNLQFFYPPKRGSLREVVSLIKNLPPLYSQFIQMSFMQVSM